MGHNLKGTVLSKAEVFFLHDNYERRGFTDFLKDNSPLQKFDFTWKGSFGGVVEER